MFRKADMSLPLFHRDEVDEPNFLGRLFGEVPREIGIMHWRDRMTCHGRVLIERMADTICHGERIEIILLDVLDRETLVEARRLVWENRGEQLFGVGSQGFEAALVAYWQSVALISTEAKQFRASAASRIALGLGVPCHRRSDRVRGRQRICAHSARCDPRGRLPHVEP